MTPDFFSSSSSLKLSASCCEVRGPVPELTAVLDSCCASPPHLALPFNSETQRPKPPSLASIVRKFRLKSEQSQSSLISPLRTRGIGGRKGKFYEQILTLVFICSTLMAATHPPPPAQPQWRGRFSSLSSWSQSGLWLVLSHICPQDNPALS